MALAAAVNEMCCYSEAVRGRRRSPDSTQPTRPASSRTNGTYIPSLSPMSFPRNLSDAGGGGEGMTAGCHPFFWFIGSAVVSNPPLEGVNVAIRPGS